MNKWALLIVAIATEVGATLSLRAAQEHPGWYAIVIGGYITTFGLLLRILRLGLPVGVTYGIWGACGTALVAALAAVIFGDPFTWSMGVGISLIVVGVLLVEVGHHRAGHEPAAAGSST